VPRVASKYQQTRGKIKYAFKASKKICCLCHTKQKGIVFAALKVPYKGSQCPDRSVILSLPAVRLFSALTINACSFWCLSLPTRGTPRLYEIHFMVVCTSQFLSGTVETGRAACRQQISTNKQKHNPNQTVETGRAPCHQQISTNKGKHNLFFGAPIHHNLSENAKTMRETKKAMKSMLDDVKVKLLQTDVRRVENPDFCIDVAEQATVCQLDVNRLKKEAPDIYKQYLIHRQRRASARLRLK
jgi:hypothetical protein